MWLVLAMITLIGDVIPFFTFAVWAKPEQVTAWPWLDWLLLIGAMLASVLTAIGLLLQTPQMAGGLLLLILAVGHSIRIVRWFDEACCVYHCCGRCISAYAWRFWGCVGLALWQFGMDMPPGQALHAHSRLHRRRILAMWHAFPLVTLAEHWNCRKDLLSLLFC
ncbi:MAG: NnrS family protein [Pseudomonadales bacterium]